MRFNELITGVRSDIAIKVFGEDLDYLNKKALQIKKLVEDIPGAADVILEKTAGLPQMIVNYNWDKIARYGLNTDELNKQLTMAFGGAIAGKVFEGEKRFDIAVRFDKNFRKDIENIRQINISLPNGSQIPLTEVAKIDYSSGPARISRDDAHRRVVVSVNVRNRDLESVVKDIEKKIDDELELMPGYYVDYGGQFENLKNATNRLSLAVPVSLLLIFIFLHFAFKSLKEATLIFTAVPLSAVGGVLFLWLRGMPFSVSAGIGFIALFGVAVLNGIVLIEYLKELKQQGITDTRELVIKATTGRLRPVLLTAAAAALGFLPMAISTSAGAEVQRPLATVVIGGLITSTLLTMIALPLLYAVLINIEGVKLFPPKLIRKSMIITVPLIFIFGFNANSQSKSLSLEDAIQVGISNNSELKSYHLDAQKTLALIPTAYDFNPTSFSYEYDANNIAGNGYPLSVISVEQSFKLPKYYKTRKKFNELNYNISSVKYQIKKKELEKTISIQYLEVVYLENMKKYLDKLDSIYNKLLIAVNRKFELGEISEIEKLNVFAKKQEIELKKNQLQLEINISLDKFNSVLQSDTVYYVKFQSLKPMDYEIDSTQENIFITYLNRLSNLELQKLKIEKNKLLPDFSLGLFTGTNIQKDSRFYNGISLGMGVPILRKDKNAKIKAMEISLESLNEKNKDFKIKYFNKLNNLKSKLEKYNYAISYYNDFGDMLFKKILNTAQKSYDLGQIDIFKYLQSIETAMNMKMDYYDNLYKRNKKIIELKYFTY
ncbi:MAG TPA: CusA/CzcA family heavy metal efflux RND transporter, partial [Bacteroidetes bacterium]|nr:CusA/CzcA family heavy metal efflux RND transporter [Bacteroidota bacterium]